VRTSDGSATRQDAIIENCKEIWLKIASCKETTIVFQQSWQPSRHPFVPEMESAYAKSFGAPTAWPPRLKEEARKNLSWLPKKPTCHLVRRLVVLGSYFPEVVLKPFSFADLQGSASAVQADWSDPALEPGPDLVS